MSNNKNAPYQIDPAKLVAVLSRNAKNKIGSFAFFDVIDSTNDYLMAKENPPHAGFALCIAAQQTSGKGRRGRAWISPAGGVYVSVGWKPPHHMTSDNWYGLMAAFFIARHLSNQSPFSVGVKWPNDLYCKDRKLGGVLLETATDRYVIGVGLNVVLDKTTMREINGISLEEIQVDVSEYTKFVASIIQTIMQSIDCVRNKNAQSIRKQYHPYDMIYGRTITVHCNGCVWSGVASGVNNEGMLQLRTEQGLRVCDIHQSSVSL